MKKTALYGRIKTEKGRIKIYLQESAEMYLETIYVLSKKTTAVRSIDVADYMGYSKPSVSRAVGLLKKGGLLTMAEDGSLILTEEGINTAKKIFERHNVLSSFLKKIGVSEETASKDACKIEHVISEETVEAIKKFLELS